MNLSEKLFGIFSIFGIVGLIIGLILSIAYLISYDKKKKRETENCLDHVIQRWLLLNRMNKDLIIKVKRYINNHAACSMSIGNNLTLGMF